MQHVLVVELTCLLCCMNSRSNDLRTLSVVSNMAYFCARQFVGA